MKIKIGINGFGRIGRLALRAILERHPDLEVAAINDRGTTEINAYMFKFDSNYGIYPGEVEAHEGYLCVGGRQICIFAHTDPREIPWREAGVSLVIEATGAFAAAEKAAWHLEGGAQRVLVTAPAKGADAVIVLGVNEGVYDPASHHILSAASCTTNCLAPVVKILAERFGIRQGMMSTIHSYTNDQRILDKSHPDPRRARAAAANIIPTTTGATQTLADVLPEMAGKFHGVSYRVPTLTVSVIDLVADLENVATAEAINTAFRVNAAGPMADVLDFSSHPLVSTDFRGNPHSAVIDGPSTTIIDGGSLARVVAWYDNEWGYACRIGDLAQYIVDCES